MIIQNIYMQGRREYRHDLKEAVPAVTRSVCFSCTSFSRCGYLNLRSDSRSTQFKMLAKQLACRRASSDQWLFRCYTAMCFRYVEYVWTWCQGSCFSLRGSLRLLLIYRKICQSEHRWDRQLFKSVCPVGIKNCKRHSIYMTAWKQVLLFFLQGPSDPLVNCLVGGCCTPWTCTKSSMTWISYVKQCK